MSSPLASSRTVTQLVRVDDALKVTEISYIENPAYAGISLPSMKPAVCKASYTLADTTEDPFAQSVDAKSYYADLSNLRPGNATLETVEHVDSAWHKRYSAPTLVSFPSSASTTPEKSACKQQYNSPSWGRMGFPPVKELSSYDRFSVAGVTSPAATGDPLFPPGLNLPYSRVNMSNVESNMLSSDSRRTQWPSLTPTSPQNFNTHVVEDAMAQWASDVLYSLGADLAAAGIFPNVSRMGPAAARKYVGGRIMRILRNIECPKLVIVHAFWYIAQLTRRVDDTTTTFIFYDFLFRQGARTVEEAMLRAFVSAAMISDKWINDCTFSTKTWRNLTSVPVASLNATESFMFRLLDWKTAIPSDQWRLWLQQLQQWGNTTAVYASVPREPVSPRVIMDMVIDSILEEDSTAIPPTSPLDHTLTVKADSVPTSYPGPRVSSLPSPAEWCPEADEVVLPGPRRHLKMFAPGAHRDQFTTGYPSSIGTSFVGPFGVIGNRLTQDIMPTYAPWPTTASWSAVHG
ncbi:hypothetical protein BJ138DRAFT_687943 [Hygrophoropsis aurantiaca]|uniref:Uncharacterized protein n=1 Tax=Hygrophoropsis aurantiaca TaxID=72124 RepID=A0ACB8ASE9_9AGAM|nr:hypothetical protein BJ138DRAFT_687943 [Hygrophoropsis aurantiaca]